MWLRVLGIIATSLDIIFWLMKHSTRTVEEIKKIAEQKHDEIKNKSNKDISNSNIDLLK